ncbi:MAG: SRPBCC family protein [Paenibacillaceae bacterium]|nr:SRPBCC family protein [Paenibacillaceae bacterium]
MLAELQRLPHGGCTARFDRVVAHPAAEVWAYLTEDGKLQRWFPELSVAELREGGSIRFDMGDGTFEEMRITELEPSAVLAYTWADDHVRFELKPVPGGCRLTLLETIRRITPHTPKDLAGWDVCLDAVQALLDGRTMDRKSEWELRYEKYKQAIDALAAE